MSDLSPQLKLRIFDEIRKTSALTRPQLTRRHWLAAAAGSLLTCALAVMRGTDAWSEKPLSYVLLTIGAAAISSLSVTWALIGYARTTLGPDRVSVRRITTAAMPIALGGVLIASLFAPTTLAWPTGPIAMHAMCGAVDFLSGAMLAALGVFALRNVDPTSPRVTAAAIGAASGSWVALALGLSCRFYDPLHVVVTHILPITLLISVAARFGERWIGSAGPTSVGCLWLAITL